MSARNLGSLTIDLILKTVGLTQGADKAERELDKRGKAMTAKAKKIGKEIGLALSAVGGIAIAGITKYIANTIEAEKVQAQLASRIKDTGAIAGRTIQQLNTQAESLQKITIFDDEAIGNVQAMLLTFKDIRGVQFDKATASVLDLSTAMGTDAQSAALQLGKALNDPIKGISALGRAGVQFTVDQKAVIKALVESGEKAKAQEIILAELESQMGTAAEAARETLGGALQGLKNSFDDLLEGDTSGGGLKGTVDAINDLSDVMTDPGLKSGIDTIAGGLLRIASSAIQAIANLGTFASNLNSVFANAGLAPGKEIEQLTARRDKIEKALGGTLIGKMFPDTVKGELDRLDKEIAAYPFRNVTSSVSGIALPYDNAGGSKAKKAKKSGRTGKSDAEREAEQLEKALRRMADAEREWNVELEDNGNPIAQEYADRLADLTAQTEKFKEDGIPTAEIEAFTERMKALATSIQSKELAEFQKEFTEDTLALAAATEGPGAAAMVAYRIEVGELNKELENGLITHEMFAERLEAMETPYEGVLAAIAEETRLLGMSAEAQEIYNNLKAAGTQLTDEQRESIIRNTEALQEAREAAEFMNETQSSLADSFADFITGAKSAKGAFGDFADELFKRAAQFVADQAIKKLFESFSGTSTSSSGSGGFDWASLFGSFFGGGKASGGTALPQMMYQVNERGFEMATVGGRDYMLTGSQPVQITPNNKIGGGLSQTNNIVIQGVATRQTIERASQLTGREAQRALARTGR